MARHVARDMADSVQKSPDANISNTISVYLETQITTFRGSLPPLLFKKVIAALWSFIAEVGTNKMEKKKKKIFFV
jgi:hypothetical protein